MRNCKFILVVAGMLLVVSNLASAQCLSQKQVNPIEVKIESCEPITLKMVRAAWEEGGMSKGAPTVDYERFYKGALLSEADSQKKFVYSSDQADPCKGLEKGSVVKKIVSYACCDTGRWGKCMFDGAFLVDEGKPAFDAHQ